MCAYGYKDAKGIIKCGIEQAYYEGKISWKKPISCHLYPIKINRNKAGDFFELRAARDLVQTGLYAWKKWQVPAYIFLKEAIIRKYGQDFYDALEQIAENYLTTFPL